MVINKDVLKTIVGTIVNVHCYEDKPRIAVGMLEYLPHSDMFVLVNVPFCSASDEGQPPTEFYELELRDIRQIRLNTADPDISPNEIFVV